MTRSIVLLAAALCLPTSARAQTAGREAAPVRWEVGASGALFMDYPSSDPAWPFCERTSSGVALQASYWLLDAIGLEAGLVVTRGLATDQCLLPGLVQQQPGVPFTRTRYADGDFGTGSFTPTVGVVVEPFRGAPISPRGRFGLGRMLGQGEGVRSLGGGVRYGFGAHALTMDVDWWALELDVISETVVLPLSGGSEQVLMQRPFGSDHNMFLVRVGWSMRL